MMDVTLVPQNHLGRMPEELLLEIIKQPCLSDRDLISLARTNRRHYRVAISFAYKAHIEREQGIASEFCTESALSARLPWSKTNPETQVFWAIENERHETLDRLIENDVDVNMIIWNYEIPSVVSHSHAADGRIHCSTPLAWAASLGKNCVVGYLLDHGADIELESNLCGCSDGLLDASYGPPPVPFIADNITTSSGWTPLHYALCAQHTSTAHVLLERGADAGEMGGGRGVTALHTAVRRNMDDMIDYLVTNNLVDINAQNYIGVTALHLAHLAGRYDLVEELLDKGADINLAYHEESGPWNILAMACAGKLFDQALHYLRRGADPHFVLQSGRWRFTVMRLIYQGPYEIMDLTDNELNQMMELEKEIIAAGGPSLEDT